MMKRQLTTRNIRVALFKKPRINTTTCAEHRYDPLLKLDDDIVRTHILPHICDHHKWSNIACTNKAWNRCVKDTSFYPLAGKITNNVKDFFAIGYANVNLTNCKLIIEWIRYSCWPGYFYREGRDAYHSTNMWAHAMMSKERIRGLKLPIAIANDDMLTQQLSHLILRDNRGMRIACTRSNMTPCIKVPMDICNTPVKQYALIVLATSVGKTTQTPCDMQIQVRRTFKYRQCLIQPLLVGGRQSHSHRAHTIEFQISNDVTSDIPSSQQSFGIRYIFQTFIEEYKVMLLNACKTATTQWQIRQQVKSVNSYTPVNLIWHEEDNQIEAEDWHLAHDTTDYNFRSLDVIETKELEKHKLAYIEHVIEKTLYYIEFGIIADPSLQSNAIDGKFIFWLKFQHQFVHEHARFGEQVRRDVIMRLASSEKNGRRDVLKIKVA
jgi:hypothetical protein